MNDATISDTLRLRIEKLPNVTTRPMFGYQCYSVNGKFFVGFNNKNMTNMIIRLTEDFQKKALTDISLGAKPFSHGARMGWIEIEMMNTRQIEKAFQWVKKGYECASKLSEE